MSAQRMSESWRGARSATGDHWKDESMSEYSERCCYCGDFYLAYGVVRAVMNGTLHTRIRCRYYLASAANATATPSVLDGDA